MSANDAYNDAETKLTALKPTQERYNQLMAIKSKTDISDAVKSFVNTKNNGLHSILDEVARKAPKDFYIRSVTTDDLGVSISCVTNDKSSSVAVLKMQLDTIQSISDVYVHEIQANVDESGKKQYQYSITFNYSGLTKYDIKTAR